MHLYVSIIIDVWKINYYIQDLYVGIAMDVKKPTTIYETYKRILDIWNDLMKIRIERIYVLHVWFHDNVNKLIKMWVLFKKF